jgi:hypothetical protein
MGSTHLFHLNGLGGQYRPNATLAICAIIFLTACSTISSSERKLAWLGPGLYGNISAGDVYNVDYVYH